MVGHDGRFDATGGGAPQGRMQGRGRDGEFGQNRVDELFEVRLALGVGDERAGQGTDFHGLALVARGLHPGIVVLVVELGVLRVGDAVVGMLAVATGLVPGVFHILGDGGKVHLAHLGQVAVHDDAGGEEGRFHVLIRRAVVGGEFSESHVVGAAADAAPVLVETGHGQQVRDVDIIDELADFLGERQVLGQRLLGQALVVGAAAHHRELGVGVLATEDGHGAGGLDLHVQGFQVVRRGDEVDFGGQVVGLVPAEEEGVGEDTELAGIHEGLELGLNGLEGFGGVAGAGRSDGGGQFGGLVRIGLQGVGHVHPVEGVQVIEMDEVVMEILGSHDQIAHHAGIGRNGDLDGVIHAAGGGQGVDVRAHAAGTLGEVLGVPGIAALQDEFQATEKLGRTPGVLDLAIFDFDHDPQMPFDPGDGIDHDGAGEGGLRRGFALSHLRPPSRKVWLPIG